MVRIKVHRGTHQIGGSITEIYTKNTHIFIDFGSELNADSENTTDEEMVEMMRHAKCDAVLFTHYHGDHIGLLRHIPLHDSDGKIVKLGMGRATRGVLINIHRTLNGFEDVDDEHGIILDILTDKKRMMDTEDSVPIIIGDLKVTPVRVDHSAYDAYMFIIESEGKTIVHTGDFRTHGRLGKRFFERIEKVLGDKKTDVLITEGTMMSRPGETVLSEEQLQDKAAGILEKPENKYAFLICSSTNAESLASFSNAAMKLGRAFYVNHYVYAQILLYRETAGADNPAFRFWKTYRFENMEAYNPRLKMSQPEYMMKNGFLMLIGSTDAYKKRMDYFKKQNPLLIYSLWDGYVRKGADTWNEKWGKIYHSWNPERRVDLHTGGHASADDIRRMILAVKPQKFILPIHTEKPEMFGSLDIGEYSRRIKKLNDGEIVEV